MKPSRSKVYHWIVVIDSLKRQCVKLTKKLDGRGRTMRFLFLYYCLEFCMLEIGCLKFEFYIEAQGGS